MVGERDPHASKDLDFVSLFTVNWREMRLRRGPCKDRRSPHVVVVAVGRATHLNPRAALPRCTPCPLRCPEGEGRYRRILCNSSAEQG